MPLLHEKRGPVAIITLSRPQARNAWGEDYKTGLKELLPQLEDDRDIRCVILTGDDSGRRVQRRRRHQEPEDPHHATRSPTFIEDLPNRRRRYQAMNLI